jgi:hypothetical protein
LLGCLIAVRAGENAEIRCNECDALIATVPIDQAEAAIIKLANFQDVTTERCPQLRGGQSIFGFSAMEAYVCKQCGEGVSRLSR